MITFEFVFLKVTFELFMVNVVLPVKMYSPSAKVIVIFWPLFAHSVPSSYLPDL